jgi:hypothetical protein
MVLDKKIRLKMSDLQFDENVSDIFLNKINVPLPMVGDYPVQETLDILRTGSVRSKGKRYNILKYIKSVYAPVHIDDGGSGRGFLYPYRKETYIDVLKEISSYVDLIITYPDGEPDIMEEYISYGANGFMVTNWKEEYQKIKNNYEVSISRSVVGNAYNKNFDGGFDGYVVPDGGLLDYDLLEKIKKDDRNFSGMPNLLCKTTCPYLDEHVLYLKENGRFDYTWDKYHSCPSNTKKSFFIPRPVLVKLLREGYIDSVKLVGRNSYLEKNISVLLYYIFGEAYPNIEKIYNHIVVNNNWMFSNMVSLNCKYDCLNCDRKCY